MALDLLTTTAFEKDVRRTLKQGKDLNKLEGVVNLLRSRSHCRHDAGLMRCAGIGRDIGIAMWSPTGSSFTN